MTTIVDGPGYRLIQWGETLWVELEVGDKSVELNPDQALELALALKHWARFTEDAWGERK